MTKTPSLQNAYALEGTEDVKDLYQVWANTYDTGFAANQGYQLPREVARVFAKHGGVGPVLDVGAGTGLGAVALSEYGIGPIDGVDLSPDMLAFADQKGLYRKLIEGDITKPLAEACSYRGIVSAGTFTLGHVGPDGLDTLLQTAATGTLFVISVNAKHFETAGFGAFLERRAKAITGLRCEDVRIYDNRADAAHQQDMARLLIFRSA